MRELPHFYNGNAGSFSDFVERSEDAHRRLILEDHAVEDEIVGQHLTLQHKLANCWVGLFVNNVYGFHESKRLVFNAFQSNLFHLHSVRLLIRNGLIGSAYPVLRLTYEGLVFAKYCSISQDVALYRRWEAGDHRLSLRNDVLNKILAPCTDELLDLWSGLCKVTHFSTYSGQPGLDIEYTTQGIGPSYSIAIILLLMNYHILNRHLITSTAEYYVKEYGNAKVFTAVRQDLRALSKKTRANVSKKGRQLIHDFVATWRLK